MNGSNPPAHLTIEPNAGNCPVKKSSWWKCFFAALGVSILAVVLPWIIAVLTVGVPSMGGKLRGLDHIGLALAGLFIYMLLFFSIPLAISILSAITSSISVSRYPVEPVKACRMAMLHAFLTTLIIWGILLPGFLRYMRAS